MPAAEPAVAAKPATEEAAPVEPVKTGPAAEPAVAAKPATEETAPVEPAKTGPAAEPAVAAKPATKETAPVEPVKTVPAAEPAVEAKPANEETAPVEPAKTVPAAEPAVAAKPATDEIIPIVTKAKNTSTKASKKASPKVSLAQAILAAQSNEAITPAPAEIVGETQDSKSTAAQHDEPKAPEISQTLPLSPLPPEELDAELLFSLQHCGVPAFLKSPWGSEATLELRVRALFDLWGQYFSALISASEKVREIPPISSASPRSQASLRGQVLALGQSPEAQAGLGGELAQVFWNSDSTAKAHTQLLGTLEEGALIGSLTGSETQQWLTVLQIWVEASKDFWGATEQLFEEPSDDGTLEGFIVYDDQYLELVDCPLQLLFPEAWIAVAEEQPAATPGVLVEVDVATIAEADLEPVAESTESPAAEVPASAEVCQVNLEWEVIETAPPYLLSQLELLKSGEISREEALRRSFYFLVQYYAGVVVAAGIQLRDLDVGSIEAFTHDSTIEARREMLEVLLPDSLACESDVFKELALVWQPTDGVNIQPCSSLNFWNASFSATLPIGWQQICAQWLRSSNPFWSHCEHHCEDSDEQRQDIVVQFKGDFFELVHPDYSLELEPKLAAVSEPDLSSAAELFSSPAAQPVSQPADLLSVSQEGPTAQPEMLPEAAPIQTDQTPVSASSPDPIETLFGVVESGSDSLFSGAAPSDDLTLEGSPSLEGAPAAEMDSLFGAQAATASDIDSLFQVEPDTDWIEKLNQPTPIIQAPVAPPAKPVSPDPVTQLFAVEPALELEPEKAPKEATPDGPKTKKRAPRTEAPESSLDSKPKESQSTTVVTDLLDSILSESEAKKAKAKESSDRLAEQKAELVRQEESAKAEIVAIAAGVPSPTGVPCLEVVVQYAEKKQGVHTGTLLLKNIGGGTIKGTLKSLHPSVRLRPTVFRENDTTVEFSIDDSDKPGNLKKNALAVNLQGGAKQEMNFDRLLPAAGLAQIRTKVFDLVKQLGASKKPKSTS